MALIARIHAAGSSTARTVRLRKAPNRLELQPGERVEIVDEATGQAPAAALSRRQVTSLLIVDTVLPCVRQARCWGQNLYLSG